MLNMSTVMDSVRLNHFNGKRKVCITNMNCVMAICPSIYTWTCYNRLLWLPFVGLKVIPE